MPTYSPPGPTQGFPPVQRLLSNQSTGISTDLEIIIQSQHSSLSLRVVLIGCFYTGLPAGYQTCYWTLADKFFLIQ